MKKPGQFILVIIVAIIISTLFLIGCYFGFTSPYSALITLIVLIILLTTTVVCIIATFGDHSRGGRLG